MGAWSAPRYSDSPSSSSAYSRTMHRQREKSLIVFHGSSLAGWKTPTGSTWYSPPASPIAWVADKRLQAPSVVLAKNGSGVLMRARLADVDSIEVVTWAEYQVV